MIEQIEQLEARVGALIGRLEDARCDLDQLRLENHQLREELARKEPLERQNAEFREQLQELEGQLEGMSGEKSQIRERLKSILERIDALEHEISTGGE